jgi:hypothetical protein
MTRLTTTSRVYGGGEQKRVPANILVAIDAAFATFSTGDDKFFGVLVRMHRLIARRTAKSVRSFHNQISTVLGVSLHGFLPFMLMSGHDAGPDQIITAKPTISV